MTTCIYRAIVVAKLTCTSSAWIGFPHQPTAKRSQLLFDAANALASVQVNLTTSFFSSLCDTAGCLLGLFTWILRNLCHVLQALLTPPADHNNLRDRLHNRQLFDRLSHLINNNCYFTVGMLFCDSYWLYSLYSLSCILSCITIQLLSDNCSINPLTWASECPDVKNYKRRTA